MVACACFWVAVFGVAQWASGFRGGGPAAGSVGVGWGQWEREKPGGIND